MSRREFLRLGGAGLAAAALAPLAERTLRRAVESAQALPSKPNIVVLFTDDQDIASLPVMDKLLSYPHGDWVRFDGCYCNEARCCPSRAAFLSGQYSRNHGVTGNGRGKFFDGRDSVATWLQGAGYRTGFIGKYFIKWKKGDVPPGWDYWQLRSGTVDKHIGQAVDFIQSSVAMNKQFLLWMPFVAPHAPADPGRYKNENVYVPDDAARPNYNEEDVSDKPTVIRRLKFSKKLQANWHKERIKSQQEIKMIDDGVLTIMDALEAAGVLNNTVVIFISDNGFSWGAHRYIHKHLPHEESSNVPLFIRYPGLGVNRVEPRLVSNIDIAPTIAELAGVTPGRVFDGRSLVPLIENPAMYWPEAVLMERTRGKNFERFYGIRVPGWMYAQYYAVKPVEEELYDMEADPYQLTNLANNPAYADMKAQLRAQMEALLAGAPVATVTPTATAMATQIPTETSTPTPTNTPTAEPTQTASPTATATEIGTDTPTATDVPMDTATATAPATSTATFDPTATATATPTCTPTPGG